MIIAPLSTPIMAIALGIVKRERIRARPLRHGRRAGRRPHRRGLRRRRPRGHRPPGQLADLRSHLADGLIDLVAAIATGFAGAVALSRRDVAAVLPGVAIAISLVPPLAVVGVCLGEGSVMLALGALLLFLSNLVALVLAGTILFAALGYSAEADRAARLVGAGRTRFTLTALLLAVLLPLGANTALVAAAPPVEQEIQTVSETWLAAVRRPR